MAHGVIARVAAVETFITAHLAVVETIKVDALPIDLFEKIAGIEAILDIPRGIDRHRHRIVQHIDNFGWKADEAARVVHNLQVHGVSGLQSVAPRIMDFILLKNTPAVARGLIQGMCADAIPSNIAQFALPHYKIFATFLEQDSASSVVMIF